MKSNKYKTLIVGSIASGISQRILAEQPQVNVVDIQEHVNQKSQLKPEVVFPITNYLSQIENNGYIDNSGKRWTKSRNTESINKGIKARKKSKAAKKARRRNK